MIYLGYTDVGDLAFANEEGTAINCMVKFDHLPEPVPFTATERDSTLHGPSIFGYAMEGHFGPIVPYVAPPPPELVIEEEQPAVLTRKEFNAIQTRLTAIEGKQGNK